MKYLLYTYPFLFVLTTILTFVFYKINNNVFWVFLIFSSLGVFRFRNFFIACVFVVAIYLLGGVNSRTTITTTNLIKGRVYDVRKNKHLTLYVKTKHAKIYLIAPKIYDNIEPYDNILFRVKLISHIKKGWFRDYLLSKGIGFVGYASYIKKIRNRKDIFTVVQHIKDKIESEFYYFLGRREYIFLQSAIFGDSENKSLLRAIFVNTQTAHIMSVSGLHMGFVFGLFYMVFYFLFSNMGFVYKRFSLKTSASIVALFPTLLYFAISGFHIPAIRSFLMVVVFIIALIYGYSKNSYNILFFIASLMPVFFGYKILLNPSFVMSFFMSFVAIYLYGFVKYFIESKIYSYIVFSFLISLFAIPVTAFYFHKIAYLSFLSNFVVVPYFGFVVMPLSFVSICFSLFSSFFFLKYFVFLILNMSTSLLLWIVERFAFIHPLDVRCSIYLVIVLYMVMFLSCEGLKIYFNHNKISTSSR